MGVYIAVCVIIVAVANVALEIVEYRDFRRGDPDPVRSYTFSGMLKRMRKDWFERRKAKRAEKKSKNGLS